MLSSCYRELSLETSVWTRLAEKCSFLAKAMSLFGPEAIVVCCRIEKGKWVDVAVERQDTSIDLKSENVMAHFLVKQRVQMSARCSHRC